VTQFYINADGGNDGNTGLGPLDAAAWATLDNFTEASRSAGDIATLRRGTTAQYDDGTVLDFTSDGQFENPILIEADYDDVVWTGGPDFVNSSQTYTPIFGSKTMEASATITVIVAGEWIFNTTDGDDPREFSYEVASVSGTTLTLHLPFKGSTGTTKTLKVMPANPVWGATTSHAFEININADFYWKIQGLDIKSTDTTSNVVVQGQGIILLKDFFIDVAGTNAEAVGMFSGSCFLRKGRTNTSQPNAFTMGVNCSYDLEDILTEGETTLSFNRSSGGSVVVAKDCEFAGSIESNRATHSNSPTFIRNCILPATEFVGTSAEPHTSINSQDHDGVVGASYLFKPVQQTSTDPLIVEETTTVRSGGSNTSLKVAPAAGSAFSTVWELSREVLLELDIFATTASKKYEIFMRPTATADWTADPTADELWLEIEYWAHASNNYRRITKSTETIDMNGSTTYTALSVTVAPAQQGMAFLRVYYAKPKEAQANTFFIDPIPVIT